jgi:dihydroorotase
MFSRRRFLSTAGAASLSTLARIPDVRAAQYDVLIRGGRVIDPIRNFDRVADVAITNGKIAAVRADIASASAGTTFDASGKLVVPGLIDIHTHAVREKEDAALCLIDGVTSIVDAGSRGSDRRGRRRCQRRPEPDAPADQHLENRQRSKRRTARSAQGGRRRDP